MKASRWKAYLPITTKVKVSRADIEWFAARGVSKDRLAGALAVMRHVRRDVLTLRYLNLPRPDDYILRLSFLVHDRDNGVPAPRNDHRIYLDITIEFYNPIDAREVIPKRYLYVRPDHNKDSNTEFFKQQSSWYLKLVESQCLNGYDLDILKLKAVEGPDAEILKIVGQHLHLFANMSQLEVK